MVSAQDSGSKGPSSSPGQGHCVVLLVKTPYSQCPSPPTSINGYWQTVRPGLLIGCGKNLEIMRHF